MFGFKDVNKTDQYILLICPNVVSRQPLMWVPFKKFDLGSEFNHRYETNFDHLQTLRIQTKSCYRTSQHKPKFPSTKTIHRTNRHPIGKPLWYLNSAVNRKDFHIQQLCYNIRVIDFVSLLLISTQFASCVAVIFPEPENATPRRHVNGRQT